MKPDFLDVFFPFFFETDKHLVVQRIGSSLHKIAPNFQPGLRLPDLIRIRHPLCPLTLNDLLKRTDELFLLDLLETNATLRGQWFLTPQQPLVFAGSLWTKSLTSLVDMGLSLEDFAPIDMTIENIMLREGQNAQAEDHRRLIQKLEASVNRENELQAVEKSLAQDLDLYADLLLRFKRSGELEDCRSTDCCPIDVKGLQEVGNVFEHDQLGPTLHEAMEWLELDGESHAVEFEVQRNEREYYFEGRIAEAQDHDFLFLARDVTERKEIARHLENLAHHDSLTQLPNRAYFESRLQDAFVFGQPFALLLIDVNEFKVINDSYGHLVGDHVLRGIASRIQQACDENELAARWGGDEFAVLAEYLPSPEAAQEVAERIVSNIMQPLEIEEDAILHPKVSVGIVIPNGSESFADLLRNVDIAMYKSKDGRTESHITCFEDSMLDRFMDRLVLKKDLEKALRRNELRVFYQPIYDLQRQCFTKCEALVRWQHPERGLLSPFFFVDLAEESGLISELGRQVLVQASQDARTWGDVGTEMSISVNVSASQLQEPGFFQTILQAMEDNEIEAKQLTIEITESVLVTNAEHAVTLLNALKDVGIRVAIDDFGVGYSSLQYLAKLPVDIVKIDKTFVHELDEESGAGYRLFEAMVNLGRTLGLEIVAEGIETEEHERQVRAFGCDYGQGYLYSKPVPLEEAFLLTQSPLAPFSSDKPPQPKSKVSP